jgi:uncharacterized protein YfcZ (UPF0381/DUF406 family)
MSTETATEQDSTAKTLRMIAEARAPRSEPDGGDMPPMQSAALEALKMAHQTGADLMQALEATRRASISQKEKEQPAGGCVTVTIETILNAADLISEFRRVSSKLESLESSQKHLADALTALDKRVCTLEAAVRETKAEI